MSRSDSPTSFPPHFVSFVRRYVGVLCFRSPGTRPLISGDLEPLGCRGSEKTAFPTRRRGLPGSWGNPGVRMPGSSTPAGLHDLPVPPWRCCRRSMRGRRHPQIATFRGSITRPSHSLSTLRSACCQDTTQDSLLAGGQPLPGGIRTRWVTFDRFQTNGLPPFPGFAWRTAFCSLGIHAQAPAGTSLLPWSCISARR